MTIVNIEWIGANLGQRTECGEKQLAGSPVDELVSPLKASRVPIGHAALVPAVAYHQNLYGMVFRACNVMFHKVLKVTFSIYCSVRPCFFLCSFLSMCTKFGES